jgi:hypothetical protein
MSYADTQYSALPTVSPGLPNAEPRRDLSEGDVSHTSQELEIYPPEGYQMDSSGGSPPHPRMFGVPSSREVSTKRQFVGVRFQFVCFDHVLNHLMFTHVLRPNCIYAFRNQKFAPVHSYCFLLHSIEVLFHMDIKR